MGTLSIVATPIGNLEDITLRALRVLREADGIFAEDTRVAQKLLAHYDIHTKAMRCDANKEAVCAAAVIRRLEAGEKVAYVSDAGTPGISDPGAYLVHRVREELPDATIEAIPGASSITAALSIAGITSHTFHFLGFLPHKKGRQTLFTEIGAAEEPVVFLESTHRIMKTLESLSTYAPMKRVILCRELTKKFEEVASGTAGALHEALTARPERQKGEFVVIVDVC
jgi:16S rRNA (cytidine1402-2'-O)-methyltransferase